MRISISLAAAIAALTALALLSPAQAAEYTGYVSSADLVVAQNDDADQEERDAEEERRDRAEARRERAEARRQRAAEREHESRRHEDERDDHDDDYVERHAHRTPRVRAWVGIGAGVGAASIAVPCDSNPNGPKDCNQSGDTGTYTANFTIAGPYTALRVRGIREQDKGDDDRTPYEEALLVGSRFGTSNWYGLVGAGRVLHADDKHPNSTGGFAWEILFAPSSMSALGMELSFQGELGNDVDFVALNLGMRLGALR